MASVNRTCNVLSPSKTGVELGKLFVDILADLTALNSAVTAMAAKLNADAGVTDTNYAAPAALKTTA